MKHLSNIILKLILPCIAIPAFIAVSTGCNDEFEGDGIDSIQWTGSLLPEDSMYLNPVFEPDLSEPSVFKGPGGYYAYGNENEWSDGLSFAVPLVTSKNLMSWSLKGAAMAEKPVWAEGNLSSVSVSYSSELKQHLMFYNLGDAIGLAYSASALGPFTDFGMIANADSLGVETTQNPFFTQVTYKKKVGPRWVVEQKSLLFFGENKGIYGIELIMNADVTGKIVTVKKVGKVFKIAGNAFSRPYITEINKKYYLFGNVGTGSSISIAMGISDSITGPYFDKSGKNLLESEGTTIIAAGSNNRYQNPSNVGGLIADVDGNYWILYNATDSNRPKLPSGADRKYLMLSPVKFDPNGWPEKTIEVQSGWCYPRVSQ